MEETDAATYWCYMCSQMVNPIMEVESVKCPFCQGGFVEEMDGATAAATRADHQPDFGGGSDSDRTLSLWAPILLGMMSNPRRRRRFRRLEFEDDEDEDDDNNTHLEGETELESIIRRRRRSSATILQLLQGIRAGMLSESENSESEVRDRDRDRENRDRERVILINSFNQTIIVQGSYDSNNSSQNQNHNPIGSQGDYFIGPGLDLLLQHLADNDPNMYGTPPAKKEAVEAMPTVKIEKNLQCSVCLEDFEIGAEAKEMPCKHRFHGGCIMPWLELHSSCPVCRYQMPSDESKLNSDGLRSSSNNNRESNNGHGRSAEEGDGDGDGRSESGRRFSVPLPWPFSSLFSSSRPHPSTGNSSSTTTPSSSGSSTDAPGNATHRDEN